MKTTSELMNLPAIDLANEQISTYGGSMKILSICVGLPREIDWKGKPVRTSIFKTPVTGRIPVTQYSADSRNLVGATPAGESPSRNIDVAIGHARQTRGPWHEVRTKT
jgi:hypothetical protein